jgi:hypothetical protein
MTTTTSISVRSAVASTAALDITQPDFQHSANIAFARRGTRDAVLVLLADRDAFTREAADVLRTIEPRDAEVAANIDATIAAILWVVGDTVEAAAIAAKHPAHKMSRLVMRCIEADMPAPVWLHSVKHISLEDCFNFEK